MKRTGIVASLLTVLLLVSVAGAELELLGQGTSVHGTYNLIYDSHFDITWYDFTNAYASADSQLSWAGALSVTFGSVTYYDWRLPWDEQNLSGGECSGYNCTGSELGHLYYTELENSAGGPLNNTGEFQNLTDAGYIAVGFSFPSFPFNLGAFDMSDGYQVPNGALAGSAIAVHDGKLSVVPEPVSSTLFIIGGATLGLRRFWRKRRSI